MTDIIDYKIYGKEMQIVEVELDPQEGVRAEAGTMIYMDNDIEMQTSTDGGLFKGFKRMLTGESFFITTFLNRGRGKQHVAFSAPYPGNIIPIQLEDFNGRFICQKDAFLCAANGIEIEVEFTKRIGAGFFGREGFILQRLEGKGMAFVHAGGTIVERELKANEVLRVDTGCLVGFSPTVDYDIQFIGGFKNALFGKEGLFLTKLTGPGKVYLQSLPLSRLSERLFSGIASNKGENRGNIGGIAGGILGGFLGNDD
ncbi:TIGR00266 family protein [Thermohalobacter berrensis]|uniref:TIGR00266 family protein n=1 Tax=Thermohalobacter berrensis TaxID=99594 RepID=A0A419SUT1_9FIRM|nr:TIGR00266 family protein [Thermohalobacter berrensis]RKD28981.1 TIGR00266 family protein [Thermohalobacter berrensis]